MAASETGEEICCSRFTPRETLTALTNLWCAVMLHLASFLTGFIYFLLFCDGRMSGGLESLVIERRRAGPWSEGGGWVQRGAAARRRCWWKPTTPLSKGPSGERRDGEELQLRGWSETVGRDLPQRRGGSERLSEEQKQFDKKRSKTIPRSRRFDREKISTYMGSRSSGQRRRTMQVNQEERSAGDIQKDNEGVGVSLHGRWAPSHIINLVHILLAFLLHMDLVTPTGECVTFAYMEWI